MSDNDRRRKSQQNAAGNIAVALGALLLTGTVAVFSWMAGKDHERSQMQEEKQRESLKRSVDSRRMLQRAPVTEYNDENGGIMCVVCHENIANIVFSPCNHLCACPLCVKLLANDPSSFNCPSCRRPIESVTVVYPQ